MEEIIESITKAEERASLIKEAAYKKAEEIAAKASDECAQIAKRSETDIRIYRERSLRQAEADGEKLYCEALEKKRAEAKAYADGVIKNIDATVAEIVGRVTRGSR